MRNIPKPLSTTDDVVQRKNLARLQAMDMVSISYIKRDGLPSVSMGKVMGFSGKPGFDTGSVTIEDAHKGPRTINLHRIYRVSTI